MRKSKVLVAVVAFALVAVVIVGCSSGEGDGNSDGNGYVPPPPDTPKLPQPGEWTASVEFGEFVLTVDPSGTGISKISYNFAAFECGGIRRSGGVSIGKPSLWLITDGQFIINSSLDPWDMVIQGEFDETGTHASGTWEITGTTCSGTWESSPAS